MIYLKLPIFAHQANLAGNYHCAGFPGMTAIDGMVHTIERSLSKIDSSFTVNKWSVIAHYVDLKKGHKRFAIGNKSVDGGKDINASTVDEKQGDLDITLIIAIQTEKSFSDYNAMRKNPAFGSVFSRLRLAGGVTEIYTTPYSDKFDGRSIVFYDNYESALKTVSRQAFLIEDKTSCLGELSIKDETRLKTILRLIRRVKQYQDPDNKEKLDLALENKPEGFYVPVAIGYNALERPSIKDGTRDPEVLHAYVEPVVGIARLRKVGSVLFHLELNDPEEKIRPFWVNSKLLEDDSNVNSNNLYAIVGTN